MLKVKGNNKIKEICRCILHKRKILTVLSNNVTVYVSVWEWLQVKASATGSKSSLNHIFISLYIVVKWDDTEW